MTRRLLIAMVVALVLLGALLRLGSRSGEPVGADAAHAEPATAPREGLPPIDAPPPAPAQSGATAREALAAEATPEPSAQVEGEPVLVRISARFVDTLGRPLAGVEFSAFSIAGSPVAHSDGTGLAELAIDWEDLRGFAPQPCTFVCRGTGLTTRGERQWFGAPEDRFLGELRMEPGGAVHGQVVDSMGRGVAAATVFSTRPVLAESAASEALRCFGGRPQGAPTTTDGAGFFLLEGLPVTSCSIAAQGQSTYFAISAPVTIAAGVTLELPDLVVEPAPDELRIAGVVRSDAGALVPGAGVRLLSEDRQSIYTQALTDELGRFHFTVIPERRYALQVLDYSSHGWPDVNLEAIEPGTVDLEVVFLDTRSLRVIVHGPDGGPVRRYIATVTTMDNHLVPGGHATSGGGAPVELAAPQAPFRVGILAPGFEYTREGPFQPEDEVAELVIALKPTTGIRGQVVADGRPLAGVEVEAHAALEEGRRGLAADVFHVFVHTRGFLGDVTGADGEFFLNAPQPAWLHVHAQAPGYGRAESGPIDFDPARGADELVLELTPGGALEGRVLVGPRARPSGRTVALSRGDGHFETAVTDADGGYRFADLTPGPWQIAEVEPRELVRASSGSLGWTSPDERTPWDFEVVAGETTRFDLDLSSATICQFEGSFRVDGQAPTGWSWSVPRVLRDQPFGPQGRFTCELEESGPRLVQLIAPRTPGAFAGLTVEVELVDGMSTWEGAVETGTLELTGVDAPSMDELDLGGQVDLACVLAADLPGGLTWFCNVFAAENGAVRLLRVPAGKLRVYTDKDTGRLDPRAPEPQLELELAAGETKTVPLD